MPEWSAEIEVDAELARALVASQFPELRHARVTPLGVGWDNTVFLVDSQVFRFPRRKIALAGVELEMRVLPRLAPLLSAMIPTPHFFGQPSEMFPWPFFGADVIAGREAPDANLDDNRRASLARPIARFLKSLHGPATMAAVGHDLPSDPIRRGDMQFRVPNGIEKLDQARQMGLIDDVAPFISIIEPARTLPRAEPTAVIHGDLHFRHIMIADDGTLSGVIDWGDIQRNDPGVDLQLLWSFFPPAARHVFLDEYGPVSEASLLRARVLAVFLNVTLAMYGREESMRSVEREAIAGLRRSLSDPVGL